MPRNKQPPKERFGELDELLISLGVPANTHRAKLRKLVHDKLVIRPPLAPAPVRFTYDDDDGVEQVAELDSGHKWQSPSLPWSACDDERRAWLTVAWTIGELSWKLTPSQREAYRKYDSWRRRKDRIEAGRIFALDSSRRWGKSAILLIVSMEDCIRSPFPWREVYCAPTWEQVKRYIFPIHAALTSDCPPHLQHPWKQADRQWVFPIKPGHSEGSIIDVVGLDTNPDGARGPALDGAKLDEAGFFDNLDYLINQVLFPQMLGRAWGRLCCGSTPPMTPGHYWSTDVVAVCQKRGGYDRKTLDDADQYTAEEKEEFWLEMGGRASAAARREYGAEHIVDEHLAIIPEFRSAKPRVLQEPSTPHWRDCYTVLDPGWHDMSGVLFGYWHWELQKLVIEDELCEAKLNSDKLAERIKLKEERLWRGSYRRTPKGLLDPQPYRRYSDNDPRLLWDLANDHDLAFLPTAKDNLLQHVNALRIAIDRADILISPKCRKLVAQLENGIWKKLPGERTPQGRKQQASFAREGEFGHFDLVACLVYLWRNVERHRNPEPQAMRFIAGQIPDRSARREGVSKWSKDGRDADGVSKWSKNLSEGQSKWYKKGNTIYIDTGAKQR